MLEQALRSKSPKAYAKALYALNKLLEFLATIKPLLTI